MDYSKIPKDAFINSVKNVIKYKPEIIVKYEKYNKDLWNTRFPVYKVSSLLENEESSTPLDYEKLQLTNIGMYSIANGNIANSMIKFLNDIIKRYNINNKNDIIITEANGGLGGFTIALSHYFKNINTVEINPIHLNIIKNNLEVYNNTSSKGLLDINKIKFHNNDYLDILYTLKQDVIIFDPAWSGPSYKYKKNIQLGLNNVNITYIINDLFIHNMFKAVIMFVPTNFDIQHFIKYIKSSDIIIKKMDKHYFIAVLNIDLIQKNNTIKLD